MEQKKNEKSKPKHNSAFFVFAIVLKLCLNNKKWSKMTMIISIGILPKS
jgi:hypothetical protein